MAQLAMSSSRNMGETTMEWSEMEEYNKDVIELVRACSGYLDLSVEEEKEKEERKM
jgi:hypothetical protein